MMVQDTAKETVTVGPRVRAPPTSILYRTHQKYGEGPHT